MAKEEQRRKKGDLANYNPRIHQCPSLHQNLHSELAPEPSGAGYGQLLVGFDCRSACKVLPTCSVTGMGPHGGLAGLGLGLAGLGDGLPDVGLGVGLGLVGLGDWLGATKLGSKHPGPPNRLTQMNTTPG